MDTTAQDAQMVPMLPCLDIDRTAAFWTALGLQVTYRQMRPNPYLALERGGIALHYYGLAGLDHDQNHSTCAIVVNDTEPLHRLFTTGLTAEYGRIPFHGLPRITRPRQRANNGGLSGFSLIDPDGNWIRVSRRPSRAEETPKDVGGRTEWVSAGGGPLARAVENAIVLADSHGDEAQAERVLAGAVARQADAPVAEQAAAWSYLAELRVRRDDVDGAARARAEVARLADRDDLTAAEADAVAQALRELGDLGL